jgi:hypothetical protein
MLAPLLAEAQIVYYSAAELRQKYVEVGNDTFRFKADEESITQIAALLQAYLPGSLAEMQLNADQVFGQYAQNPFIGDQVSALVGGSSSGSVAANAIAKAKSPGIGGLNVTKLVNALADIMIERAKQELTVAFFNRFKDFAEENAEFQILFPVTTSNLSDLLTYQYPQMLPALRNGFFQDLELITYQLDDVLELPRYQVLLRNYPEVRVAIRSLNLVQQLETDQSNAADLFQEFARLPEWRETGSPGFHNMGSVIRFAALFSESFRHTSSDTLWVGGRQVRELILDETFTKLYLGLLYQQVMNADIRFFTKKIITSPDTSLADLIAAHKEDLFLFQNKISEFLLLVSRVNTHYSELKSTLQTSGSLSPEQAYQYINVSIDVLDYAFSLGRIFDENFIAEPYLNIARTSNNLYRDIYSAQYTQAVHDAIDILKSLHELIDQNQTPPSTASLSNSLSKKGALEKLLLFANRVKPFALFMANVVEAESEDEIKTALEAVILPVGSSSIKKNSSGNISIQSYLGAYYAFGQEDTAPGVWSDPFGVSAPIGISWTPGFLSWQKGGSLSLFTSLLDIGAVVDYKLKAEPDPVSADPDAMIIVKDYSIELGQIFSPGIYFVYGFGANLPLAFSVGAQYGPGLSKIDVANTTHIVNPSWRGQIALTVDLPYFTLYNKHRDAGKTSRKN